MLSVMTGRQCSSRLLVGNPRWHCPYMCITPTFGSHYQGPRASSCAFGFLWAVSGVEAPRPDQANEYDIKPQAGVERLDNYYFRLHVWPTRAKLAEVQSRILLDHMTIEQCSPNMFHTFLQDIYVEGLFQSFCSKHTGMRNKFTVL